MAAGDMTPKKLLQKALDATPANSGFTPAANKRHYVSGIMLANTGTTARLVTIYGWGTATANKIMIIPVAVGGCEILTNLPIVLEAGEYLYAAQDTGTDINITVMGREEALT